MQKKIHPKTNLILFLDNMNNYKFLAKSTINTNKHIKINKLKLKLVNIEISSESKKST